ncbi:MAG: Gfo/Idh/MocA family oxidoreductase [Eubacteriales bacterium]|nr:Gfo/Idh/MocA family oxidoreductase [Eubacteriales bacterium]
MTSKKINWGVLGCAGIAEKHVIPALLQADNAVLYGIASRSDSERLHQFEEKFRPLHSYTSYEALLSDPSIDAVYIPLPNSLHAEWVKKAAAAKKNVLCEKPLGVNASEVIAMQAACDANGVLLMEAFAYRHSPLTRTIETLIQSGQIGDIRLIEAYFCYNLQDMDNVRLKSDLKGGATYDVGCYNIDLIAHLMGRLPDSVQASAYIGPDSQVDESCLATFSFPGPVDAISYCSFRTEARNECTIVGSEGILSVSPAFNFQGTSKIKLMTKSQPDTVIVDCPNNYTLEIEQFGRCITDGEKPLVSHESSQLTARIMDKVLERIYT